MILAKYRNSLSRALLSVFPNIGLVKSLFTSGGGMYLLSSVYLQSFKLKIFIRIQNNH